MTFGYLETILRTTFQDYTLSRGERAALREVLADIADDEENLRFVRNKAFEIARDRLQKGDDRKVLGWLEDVVKSIDLARPPTGEHESQVCFSPGHTCRNTIISLIETAQKTIDICVFTITDDRITRAIGAAHARGTAVRVITDDEKAHDPGSDVFRLFEQGVAIVTDHSPDHMHHKFAVFDGTTLLNGSFNWTRSASENNHENLIVISERTLVEAFAKKFEELWLELPGMKSQKSIP